MDIDAQTQEPVATASTKKEGPRQNTDIYQDHFVFVEPMFLIDTLQFHNYTLKLNLETLIDKQRNMCRQAICLLNRNNNKDLFLQYLFCLLANKKLNLFSTSMVFMKICQVYKQASLERNTIRKKAHLMSNY